MKKKPQGMTTRQLKRKLNLKGSDLNDMLKGVHQLMDNEMFSTKDDGDRYVTFDKNQLKVALKQEIQKLESELKNQQSARQPNTTPLAPSKPLSPNIKINIS